MGAGSGLKEGGIPRWGNHMGKGLRDRIAWCFVAEGTWARGSGVYDK